MILIIHC